MAKFDAAAEVEDLDYDFTKFVKGPNAKGIIPEPTSLQIDTFREVLTRLFPTKDGADGEPVLDTEEFLRQGREGNTDDVLIEALGVFCGSKPSAATLKKLPFRAQRAFIGFIVGVFFRPEGQTPATNS